MCDSVRMKYLRDEWKNVEYNILVECYELMTSNASCFFKRLNALQNKKETKLFLHKKSDEMVFTYILKNLHQIHFAAPFTWLKLQAIIIYYKVNHINSHVRKRDHICVCMNYIPTHYRITNTNNIQRTALYKPSIQSRTSTTE